MSKQSKIDSATVIVLDVGKNTDVKVNKQDTFFETAVKCASRIIERNILIAANTHIGVTILGAAKTNNSLADQCPGAFKNIDIVYELQEPSWQMIRDLPKKSTERKGDCFEGLIVAGNQYRESITAITNGRKIVLITNFEAPANIGNKFKELVDGFKTEEFEVFVIGPDLETSDCKNIDSIKQLIHKTGGESATFEEAMNSWLFHKRKPTRLMYTNGSLFIGPQICLPISMTIRVKDEPVLQLKNKAVKNPMTGTSSTTEAVMVDKKIINPDNKAVIGRGKTISGYPFGGKVIPLDCNMTCTDGIIGATERDNSFPYSKTKTLILYGFTDKNNVDWQSLSGECTYYMYGTRKKGCEDKNTDRAITCLVHCLQELGLVGIVQYKYNFNNAPKMMAMMPVIDNAGHICLSLVALCFKEQIKRMGFPPANKEVTDEQVNAFKDLIKAMYLTKAYEDDGGDTEAFPIGETVSPTLQYVMDCIAFKALNPGKPLPQPRDEIMALMKVPPLIEKRSREPLEKIKKLFTLNKVEKKVPKNKPPPMRDMDAPMAEPSTSNGDDMPKVKLPIINNNDQIESIGTVQPSEDFKTLLEKGKKLAELSTEMSDVIESLVFTNILRDYTKMLDALKTFREECVKSGPTHYNDWLQRFRKNLLERKRDVVINIINEKGLGLILNSENSLSSIMEENTHEDSEMYDNDTVPTSTELSIQTDINDMFDEM